METRSNGIFAIFAFVPVFAAVLIYAVAQYQQMQINVGMGAFAIGIVGVFQFIVFSLVPSLIITIIGFVRIIRIKRRGQPIRPSIVYTLIAAIPLILFIIAPFLSIAVSMRAATNIDVSKKCSVDSDCVLLPWSGAVNREWARTAQPEQAGKLYSSDVDEAKCIYSRCTPVEKSK